MENQIFNEPCLDTMKRMESNSIDLVVTSPPYDNLRTYENDVDKSWNESTWKPIISELSRVIKKGGVIVWVVGDATIEGDETGTSFKQALYFKECELKLYDTMIYQKSGCASPSKKRYFHSFEYMFIFSKGFPKTFNPIQDRENKWRERWGKKRKKRKKDGSFSEEYEAKKASQFGMRYNIWKYRQGFQKKSEDTYDHPAVFPENLAHDHIISWSNEGDIVYDPFLGSGTTACMAKLTKRDYLGSEINEDYFKIAQERLEKTQEYFF
jgi:site-specific DNA-methyltransferase (adenine-specific)